MPMLLSSAVKESCCRRRIKDYLDNEFGRSPGRAIAWDYVNLSERESKHWDEVMDATRKEYGHDKDWHGRASRQYTHFIISPDPRDAVDIDTLRELTTRWVAEFFGGPTDDDWNLSDFGIVTVYQTAFGRAMAPPLTRSGVPPETPQPYSFAASLMRCGPSAQAPNGGTSPLRTTPPKSRSIWVWDMGFPWARS